MGATASGLERPPGSGLTKKDADRLKRRFAKLSQGSSKLSVNQFELLPELAGNPFLPRLFEMFDADQDGKISLSEFNAAIEFFLKLQNTSDKEEFVFNMYNLSGDGFIKENELFAMLKRSTSGKVADGQLRTIVTNTLHEYDKDGDGKLNFAEFKALLSEQDIAGTILP